jgi:hypothetical protein
MNGSVAQLVEQRTENPRVSGSTPLGATSTKKLHNSEVFLYFKLFLRKKRLFSSKSNFICKFQ